MGASLTNFVEDCQCQELFTGLCGPEEPAREQRTQLSFEERKKDRKNETSPSADSRAPLVTDDEIPPAPQTIDVNDDEPINVPASSAQGGYTGPSISIDFVLSDLERAEEQVYAEAFQRLSKGRRVENDDPEIRQFIIAHSSLTINNLDEKLFTIAPDPPLTGKAFIGVLRDGAASEEDSLAEFLRLSADGETMPSEECRSGLLLFGQQHLSISFSEDRWDCVLNTIMIDADVIVNMESWIRYCKMLARIAGLVKYCRI